MPHKCRTTPNGDASKIQLQGQLHLSRRVQLAVNYAEVASVDLDVRPTELWVVERIERLDSELQPRAFPKLRQGKILEQGEGRVLLAGLPAGPNRPWCIAQRERSRHDCDFRVGKVVVQKVGPRVAVQRAGQIGPLSAIGRKALAP